MLLALATALLVAAPPTCRDSVGYLRPDALPDGTPAAARALDTWLEHTPDLDLELLDALAIELLNERNAATIGAWRDPLTDAPPPIEDVDRELMDRYGVIGERVASGEYLLDPPPPGGEPFLAVRPRLESSLPVDRVHALVEPADLRCLPLSAGLYRGKIDKAFDRNQCSRLQPGELLRVLRVTPEGWLYVRAGHGVGWLQHPLLSPPMTPAAARDLRQRSELVVTGDLVPARTAFGDLHLLRLGARFPLVAADDDQLQLLVPTATGWEDAFVDRALLADPAAVDAAPGRRELALGPLSLTRRNLLSMAFARLGDPYGWGGLGGFRDCSGLLLDLMATFDVHLGRNSSVQALAGATVVEVEGRPLADKLAAIRAAHTQGVVFLYMPGHIMLYLGELDGRPYALSAISEYLMPCPEGGHRTVRIDRVDVTDLERGLGTERTSFLERIARLAVFGGPAR